MSHPNPKSEEPPQAGVVRLDRRAAAAPVPAAAPSDARRPIAAGLAIVAAAFGGFGLWALLAPLDSAVVAPGVVAVESSRKAVQHREGGIVAEILVREGQEVAAGAVLVRLDATEARARVAALRARLDAALTQQARLAAERDDAKSIVFAEELHTRAATDARLASLMTGEERQFAERRQSLAGQVRILEQRIAQLREEIAGLASLVLANERQTALMEDELVGLRELYEKGYYPRTRILAMERELARLAGERGSNIAAIARAENAIGESRMQILQLRQGRQEDVVAQLREVAAQINENEEHFLVAADMLRRTEIVAPQAGRVQGVKVHTVGGVVAPQAELMQIVPLDDRLVVEARVNPADIDNVGVGQEAQVRLTAFSVRTTPVIEGRVATLSADRMIDERTSQPYYLARIEVPEEELRKLSDRPLQAGMPADVIIATGSRTLFQYLVKPLSDGIATGLREP